MCTYKIKEIKCKYFSPTNYFLKFNQKKGYIIFIYDYLYIHLNKCKAKEQYWIFGRHNLSFHLHHPKLPFHSINWSPTYTHMDSKFNHFLTLLCKCYYFQISNTCHPSPRIYMNENFWLSIGKILSIMKNLF